MNAVFPGAIDVAHKLGLPYIYSFTKIENNSEHIYMYIYMYTKVAYL